MFLPSRANDFDGAHGWVSLSRPRLTCSSLHYNISNVRQYTRTVEASVSMGRRAQEDLSAAREDIIQYIRHHFGTWIELTKANGQDAVCFVHGVMSSTYVDNSVSVRSYKSEVRKATRKETHFSPWSLRRDNKDQSPQQDKYAFIHFYMAMAKKKNGGNMLERWTKIIGGTPGTRSEAFNQSPVTQVFENDAQPKGVRMCTMLVGPCRVSQTNSETTLAKFCSHLRHSSGILSETLSTTSFRRVANMSRRLP